MKLHVSDGFYIIACDLKAKEEWQEGIRFDDKKEAQKHLKSIKQLKGILYKVWEYKNSGWVR